MKVATVVGARPQFIKCGPVSRELRKSATEVLIHTGQHYDDNMSRVFFDELDLPRPDHNLEVGSGSHGAQSGEMLRRIEEVLFAEEPDWVLVYGDTNSTLAGALAAAKLQIPVAHVEAGLRSFNRRMPEEVNRVMTDHLSSFLFCPTETAVKNLEKEGITKGVELVGDVMYDAMLANIDIAKKKSRILEELSLEPKSYVVATVHRAENADDANRLCGIVTALRQISLSLPVVWPIHPRTRHSLRLGGLLSNGLDSMRLINPVSYLDMLLLEKHAAVILTDSGGVQKEAFWLGVSCVTLREETEWIETLSTHSNILAGSDPERIVTATMTQVSSQCRQTARHPEGHSAPRIVRALLGE